MSDQYEKLMDKSVNELEFTVRAANLLNNANIQTIRDLCQHSEKDLLKYRNCGKMTIREIKTKLEELGLDLECGDNTTARIKAENKLLQTQLASLSHEYVKIKDRFNIMSSLYHEMMNSKKRYRDSIKKFEEMMGRIAF